MDLYDYVLCMYEKGFDVYKRDGRDVATESIPYEDIVCIRQGENLLAGVITLFRKDSAFEFAYNTVSSDIITKVVGLIRERYTGEMQSFESEGAVPQEKQLDFYFSNLARQERERNPDNILLAFQPRVHFRGLKEGRLRKIMHVLTSKVLLESLHYCDGRELKIITRGQDFKYLEQPVYGVECRYIPVRNLKSVGMVERAAHSALVIRQIKTDGAGFSVYFSPENPTAYNYGELERRYCRA